MQNPACMEPGSLKFVNCCLPKLLSFGYIPAKILILKKVHHFDIDLLNTPYFTTSFFTHFCHRPIFFSWLNWTRTRFFRNRLVGEVKLHVAPHPPRKPEVDSARVKFHHASARVVPPWGCGAFFWGRRGRCTGMICKGWVGFHKNILMLEVKLSLRSLLMVGRQYICHLEHLQNHGISYGISFSKHPLKLPNFPAQRHLYNTQFNMEKTHGTREGLSKNKGWSLVGSIDGSPFISQAPQRVVWLHHHSLANWDSNIRSSSEFDHNGLETDRPGRLAMFFWSKKIGSGDEWWIQTNENNENKKRMEKRFDLSQFITGIRGRECLIYEYFEDQKNSGWQVFYIDDTVWTASVMPPDGLRWTAITVPEVCCHHLQLVTDSRSCSYTVNLVPCQNTGKSVEFEYLSTFGQPHFYIYIYIQSQYPLPKKNSGRCLYDFLGCFWVLLLYLYVSTQPTSQSPPLSRSLSKCRR